MTTPQPSPSDIPALVRELKQRQQEALDANNMFSYLDVKIDLAAAFPAIASHLLAQEQQIAEWGDALRQIAGKDETGIPSFIPVELAQKALSKYPKTS